MATAVLLVAASLRVAALADQGPDRSTARPVTNLARAAGVPAAPSQQLDELWKDVVEAPGKPWREPQDAWESAWANGRTFTPVPALPTLPDDAASVLALARLTRHATVDLDDVRAAAAHFGIEAPPRMDEATVQAVLTAARRAAAPTLLAAGVDVGTAVDDADVLRAAKQLGIDVGTVAGTDDVHRVMDEARAVVSPVLWASGHDEGRTLDVGDLALAGQRLGVDVRDGSGAELQDLRKIASRQLTRVQRSTTIPGVDLSTWRVQLRGGTTVARVLRWRLDDPRVRMTTEASGPLNGTASIPAFADHLTRTFNGPDTPFLPRVVLNGGFWMNRGEPDGLLVHDGTLLSDPSTRRSWVRGIRGGFGVAGDEAVVGRPTWLGQLIADDVVVELHGVNRGLDLDGDVVAFTHEWGATTGTPPGTIELVLPGVRIGQQGKADTVVAEIRTAGNTPIPADGMVVAAHGKAVPLLRKFAVDQAIRISAESTSQWSGLDQGLGAGPLLMKDGVPTQLEDWHTEGFGDAHTLRRHPRSAIGFTSDGEVLLLAADGRRPGYSVGLTVAETTRLLRSFGAVDAVMLDGGGSTHLVVDGRTSNRPCCDNAPRPVSTAIVLWQVRDPQAAGR